MLTRTVPLGQLEASGVLLASVVPIARRPRRPSARPRLRLLNQLLLRLLHMHLEQRVVELECIGASSFLVALVAAALRHEQIGALFGVVAGALLSVRLLLLLVLTHLSHFLDCLLVPDILSF